MSYYIYTLSEPDMDEFGSSQVFYVGKGCGKRVGDHEQEARKGKRSAKCDRIRAIWAAGKQVQRRIIFDTEEIAQLESDLEEIYVALGCAFQDTLF